MEIILFTSQYCSGDKIRKSSLETNLLQCAAVLSADLGTLTIASPSVKL